MANEAAGTHEWSPEALWRVLDLQQPLFVLDVREPEAAGASPIEGRGELPTRNVPYYELLDLDQTDDVTLAARAAIAAGRAGPLPVDRTLLAVCPHGHTSAHVAEALRQLGYPAVNLAGGMAAWGDYYHTRKVADDGRVAIHQVTRPARGDLSHVVVSEGQAAVVDPGRHIEVYRKMATDRGWEIRLVVDTHQHADHISGGPALARAAAVDYWLHPYDAIHPVDLLPARFAYRPLDDGWRFTLGQAVIEAVHLPGHTLGMVGFRVSERFLLSGDSVFIANVARPDLGGRPEGWTPLFYQALRRVLQWEDALVILPGHYSDLSESEPGRPFAAPLGKLRQRNPGLRQASGDLAAFSEYILQSLPRFPESYVDIKRINTGLLMVDETRAQELETGKNVCALAPR